MSDTIQEEALHPLLQALHDRIDADLPVGRRDAMHAFAKAYTRRLSAEELEEIGADGLFALVCSTFAFVDSRGLQPMVVRVFDPDPDVDGYKADGTVIETNTDDSPFLVDSVTEELAARELGITRLLHPVIGTARDENGRLERVMSGRDASHRESVMHIVVDRHVAEEERSDIQASIRMVLRDVRLVVRDFEPMQERVGYMIKLARSAGVRYSPEEVGETVRFLEWLLQGNFVLLGYREYELLDTPKGRAIRAVPSSGLGILSDVSGSSFADATPLDSLEPDVRRRIEESDLLVITKTKGLATVHRRARMDYVGVRKVTPDGEIVGEARLMGLFTSKAYMEPASKTPLVHHKLEQILNAEDLIPGSHDYKAITELFESFPKDELFQASAQELREIVVGLLREEKHGGIRVLVRRDLFGRHVSVVVAVPRDRFTATLRKALQAMFLERFHGTSVDYHLSLGETEQARIFFTVYVDRGQQIPEVSYDELEAEVERLARTWDDDLRDALIAAEGPERGAMLAETYAARFPDFYKTTREWSLVVEDVRRLEELESTVEGFVVGIGNESSGERLTRVKLYKTGGKVDLSAFMPILEALGLRVVEELPTALLGEGRVFIHDFGVLDARGAVLDLDRAAGRVTDAIAAVWRGRSESDALNRLITYADLNWRQVQVLRAYSKYRQRVSTRYTEAYRYDALAENPQLGMQLVRLFEAKFDPVRGAPPEEAAAIHDEILHELRSVASLDQDHILRSLLGTIQATVRTNAYLAHRTYLSLKIRSADVPEMPKPHPLFEIFVYSPEMEAIHLRAGMVSRGGIRWSDRREDYRTEVLGLMKAQKVKNAVIVPDGSKGGFILKRQPATVDALKQEVMIQYVTFMQGMLDVTDNLVEGGEVLHPEGVRVLDGPDPYLVVAADKGTATFSDTANAVSERYGFWLGDAFASGGSQGYDHKVLGITARGAWESVKRHFRELGLDVMSDPVTAVGIGDMSGDVFGNGMLYTNQLRLVAAFDHRHIFIDPTPDPTISFAERERLFRLPGSSWADYDRSLLSAGGDVIDRKAKSLTLSPEARAALGIADDVATEMTPNEAISEILRAPVDLLWNGGIGTYVKAAEETSADVGDRANDQVRIDGVEVRAKVVGEGGNLGFTQLGRIEYARAGGRMNTDFIDNSAGVDTSDHEVNLKILLGQAIARGELSLDERNKLLQSVAPDVVTHVLYDNYLQAQILSQELEASVGRVESYEDLMQILEAAGDLERDVEFLPSSEEMMERRSSGAGLVRPELAVLLAYAKRWVFGALLSSDLPDSGFLERDLAEYFPPRVRKKFGRSILEHPLRRELVATIVANEVVNDQGITFVSRLVTETGARPSDVVGAFRIAREVTGAQARWDDIEALDGVIDPKVQNELMTGVDWLVESTSRWYLVQAAGRRLAEAVGESRDSFAELSNGIDKIGPDAWRESHELDTQRLVAAGVPETVARRHAFQGELVHGPDIIAVARATGRPVHEVARGFFLLGERLELDWLEKQLEALKVATRWQHWARQSLEDELFAARRMMCEHVLGEAQGVPIDQAVEMFLERHAEPAGRLQRFMRGLAVEGVNDLAQLTVALRQIRGLAE